MLYAIILAGGSGSRMGADRNKVLLNLSGEPVIVHSIRAFIGLVDGIILVTRKEDVDAMKATMEVASLNVGMVVGGDSRQASVWNGLCALPTNCTHVLIHDGARCMVDEATIHRCIQSMMECGTGIASVPVTDTIKVVDANENAAATPDRSILRAVQTPQAFRVDLIRKAHLEAQADGFIGTDDASLVERLGLPVHLALGDRRNIKMTTPEDMMMAEAFMKKALPSLRVGQGYDVHRLVEGRDLILCGVKIPHVLGLLGHSDADVALHALMDAMLGAVALGDIGKHFPDTDERYRGISSMRLLEHVVYLLENQHARVTNCDITIIAQKPKLLPYIPDMRSNVAALLKLPLECVNVKATTTERLGFEGEERGITAQAVCMVEQG